MPSCRSNHVAPSVKTCNLGICMFHSREAPRLFVNEYFDGAGHRMANVLNGLAVARNNNMNFGGVMPSGGSYYLTDHGLDFHKIVDRFFGENASSELFAQKRFAFDGTCYWRGHEDFRAKRANFGNFSNMFLPSVELFDYGRGFSHFNVDRQEIPLSSYFDGTLRAAARQGLSSQPLKFARGRPSVAIHLRRGDLRAGKADHSRRVLPDSYYLELVRKIRKHLPDADVHAWSSTEQGKKGGPKFWYASNFDAFRKQGIQVHLDEDDTIVTWAHLSHAHILIMAPSFFSYVAGVLNPYCKIYPSPIDPGWMNGMNVTRPTYDRELQACTALGRDA